MTFRGLAAALLLTACAAPAMAAERRLEATLDADTPIEIENLIGDARVIPGDGPLRVTARVSADDADLADAVRLELDEGRRQRLSVVYPEEVSDFRVDSGGHGRLNTTVSYRGRRVDISSSRGERIRVDLEIHVPAGAAMKLTTVAGDVHAEGVDADLALRTRHGGIAVADGKGSLVADTGSGSVDIAGFRGDVRADTGSGDVRVENVLGRVVGDTGSGAVMLRGIDGDVVADTGSGDVTLLDVNASTIEADTGSGGVEISDASGSLLVDTGSGGLRAEGFTAGPSVEVDTGSGRVEIDGDLSAVERLIVDTGSGSVALASSAPLSLRLDLDTGSGGIRVDVPELSDVRSTRSRFRGTVGTGRGSARVDTGSGSIRISGP
jgi:DUF4097 and DUF4098 domain-containing protein YvlB